MGEKASAVPSRRVFGDKLRAARQRCDLSLRDVEERSIALASVWGSPNMRISAASLHRVELDRGGLSAPNMIALSMIYGVGSDEIFRMFLGEQPPAGQVAPGIGPNATLVVNGGPLQDHARDLLPDLLVLAEPPEETHLLPRPGDMPANLVRAVIGKRDRTMEPMIGAGSYVLVDLQKRVVGKKLGGLNEFERPIYLLLTRDAYLTGFCEFDRDREYLTLVPHPLSPASNRRMRYGHEVEVLGTVIGIAMRLQPV